MSDKPEIKVGQRWVTRGGNVVRILSTNAEGAKSIVGQYEDDHEFFAWAPDGLIYDDDTPSNTDLVLLAPSTVKREVALYCTREGEIALVLDGMKVNGRRISKPVTIEFTLLPGECAE